jgi:hypothetical protein
MITLCAATLKEPKHETFEIGFCTPVRPGWVDDLGTGENNDISQVGAFI